MSAKNNNAKSVKVASKKAVIVRKSKVASPCKVVWQIMKSNPEASRKDILAKATKRGIATYTATTQYQANRSRLLVFKTTGKDVQDEGDGE
jgi:hypothetical protein